MPVTLINLSNDLIQLTKHTTVGSFQLCIDYHENSNISDLEVNQVIAEKEGEILACTSQDAKYVCSTEIDAHRKSNLDSTPLCSETQDVLGKFIQKILKYLFLTSR